MIGHNKTILGLALSSGGVLGYAHIGVLRALEELKITPMLLSGASMGALIAVFNAAGLDAAALEVLGLKYEAQVALLLGSLVPIGKLTMPWRLRSSLQKDLPLTVFEALERPVCIAATDVQTGNAVVYDKGEIWGPLSASFCLPGIFPVARVGRRSLIDGGMSLPVPVTELRKRGAAKVLAVSLYDPGQNDVYTPDRNIPKLLERSMNLMLNNIAKPELRKADLVLRPDLKGCVPSNIRGYIQRGYDVTMQNRSAVEALLA